MKSPTRKPAVSNRRSLKPDNQSGHSQLDFVFPSAPSLVVLGRDAALEAKARENVLLAMSLSAARASSAVRFSLGHETTEEEIDRAGTLIARVMHRISSASAGRRQQLQGAAI